MAVAQSGSVTDLMRALGIVRCIISMQLFAINDIISRESLSNFLFDTARNNATHVHLIIEKDI